MHQLLLAIGLAGLLAAAPARAALVDPGAFTPAGPAITFGTAADIGTSNPSYVVGGVTVAFGGYFAGQTLDAGFPPLLSGAPSVPLALAGTAAIAEDLAAPGSPVLVGTSDGWGGYSPIAVLFSAGVNAVAFALGELDEVGGVRIEAFGADGTSLGTLDSAGTGFQTIRFGDSSGNPIRGFTVSLTNDPLELAFGIDDLTFAGERVVTVPVPGGLLLLGLGLAGLVVARRRRAGG
ncbi:MAG: PEP-CTERM sorting domain-containing protein [Rubritepida sp.]|nr:PEP-CTERM sorting domain-containing protein [Rubritepida sp.]